MKALFIPSPRQLVTQFLESDFFEDPDIIPNIQEVPEICPISDSIPDLEFWIKNQTVRRNVNTVWIHCTGTSSTTSVESIRRYWANNLGWKNPGYHVIFSEKGYTILQDLQYPTNGVRNHNAQGIHISYVGGMRGSRVVDTRTVYQQQLLHATCQMLRNRFPNLNIRGHNEVSTKACPVFNVLKEFEYLNGDGA